MAHTTQKSDVDVNNIESVPALVRKQENDYINGVTVISKYVEKSMYEDLNTVDAYLNSKHISGEFDALNREKPFFNIVIAAVNIWYRSTVILLKKIRIKSTKAKNVVLAFVATVHLHVFFRKTNFKAFLTDWGRALSRYGSSVIKFVEKEGQLFIEVISWNRLIVDPVDFDNNLKIEVLELTEAQLYKRKGYDKDQVKALCEARAARQTLDKRNKDQKADYVKLYEVHGELSLACLKESKGQEVLEGDDDIFVQQMHVISYVKGKERGKWDDFTLFSGREQKDPYMITHLIKEDGQTLSIGAVQNLFQAQWMVNHTAKAIKDQLDITSKIIFQTADGNFVGQNAFTAIENGDFMIHQPNMPVTIFPNQSHDIGALQSFSNQWKALSNELAGISESMLGNTAPSGTAWRQVETLLQENHSLFEVMKQNKAIYLEEMIRERIIPFIKKKMDTSEEISAVLEDHDISKIDSIYIRNESIKRSNRSIIDHVLKGGKVTPEDQARMIQQHTASLKDGLDQQGGQRFFTPDEVKTSTWKKMLKDFEWEVEVDVVDDDVDQDAMTTLNSLLMFFAKKQGQPLSPQEQFTVNRILTQAGSVSPIEIPSNTSVQAPTAIPSTVSPIQTKVPQTVT